MIYTTTYFKTITANNQTWNTDDSANSITPNGVIDILPDINVIAGSVDATVVQSNIDGYYVLNNDAANTQIISPVGSYGYSALVNSTTQAGQTVDCRKRGMQIIDSFKIYAQVYTGGNITCTVYDTLSRVTILATKTVNIASTGYHTFTFDTPIFIPWYQQTCTNTANSRIYFRFSGSGTNINGKVTVGNAYPDGGRTEWSGSESGSLDLVFTTTGHSIKAIQQTFKVNTKGVLGKIKLNTCKYMYTGTNSTTVTVKDGATVIGSGTIDTLPSTFADTYIYIKPTSPGTLMLVPETIYTLVITPPSDSSSSTSILIKTKQSNIYSNGALTLTDNNTSTITPGHDLYFTCYTSHIPRDISIHNTSDTNTVCAISNIVFAGSTYILNADNTGSISYIDTFTNDTYIYATNTWNSITYDAANNKLDIANSGYIYYLIDCKYPITESPILTSIIDITTGTPTIQISSDGNTWYDIDTAIVDDISTAYQLDNAANLQLDSLTSFYFRFDCNASSTCSIKTFQLNIDINTTTAQKPYIFYDTINTFKCDQAANSGINCTVELIAEESILQPIIIF